MRPDPRPLVARLTPTARRHLEAAVASAALAQHGELAPEHLVRALLSDAEGDVAMLLTADERGRILADVERTLARAPSGGSRPALSDALVRWLEDAWLVASLEWGDAAIQSGALFVTLLDRRRRVLDDVSALGAVPIDRVRAARATALTRSAEHAEMSARQASVAASASTALARFTTSFTARAREGKLDPVLGREREIQQVVDILSRRRKNNPVLVGEPGVGKTSIVEGLALAVVRGEVPESLRGVEIVALELGLLEAGASARGEMEARLTSVIREVRESPMPIVMFIDEAHTLVGAQPSGGTDAANLLKPALARGELRTIAATTFREHKKYFEKDAALDRRFQKVTIEEPSAEIAIAMLRGLVPTYEAAHGVIVRDDAIEAAVRLSQRYVAGRQLPDKCIDLLDTTAARVRGSQASRPLALAQADASITSMERELAALTRDRVESAVATSDLDLIEARLASARGARRELEARWHAQRDALERLVGARRAVLDARAVSTPDAIRREREIDVRVAREAFTQTVGDHALVAAEVDAAAVATTLEAWTGIPIGSMRESRSEMLRTIERELDRRVLGQPHAMRAIANGLRVAEAGLRRVDAPIGVFLLVGPSGVGKTETAHAIAELLYGGDRFLTTINLSEYQEKHTVSRLLGSPPGYVGYGEGGKLTEAVRQRPHSVVLLDECEKADLEVMNVFYQVLDRGVLADGEGRSIDFRNTVLLLTSNLASDQIASLSARGDVDPEAIEREIRPALARHFAPALLGRMTVVPYLPLEDATLSAIAEGELARVVSRVAATHRITLRFEPRVRERVVQLCRDRATGVRHLRAMIESHVLAPLAADLLAPRDSDARASITVDLDERGGFSASWSGR